MTDWYSWLPLSIIATSMIPAVVTFFLAEESRGARSFSNFAGAFLKLILMGILFWEVHLGRSIIFEFNLMPGLTMKLHADPLSLLFVGLSTVLWFLTTVYAIGYLEDSPNRSRFFGFFSLCVSATMGIAMAGNLITLLIFYEMLTLTTYPLVVHRGNAESAAAGNVYLAYTLSGGAVLLVGTVWLQTLAGSIDFVAKGILAGLPASTHGSLQLIFLLFMMGFGVKAGLFPLHGWLPRAMVAPAPVSALLHAVAVVKAGAFGIVRVVYDVYGIDFCRTMGFLEPLAALAGFTILFGSVKALYEDDLKRRLAFSTVSQVSYIILGAAIYGPLATIGGIVHLVHQGIMKITLFMCAGNFAETLGVKNVREMSGIGHRMPLSMGAFTVGALGMIGIPPIAGFFSKWYLGMGALAAGNHWVIWVLLLSSLLNAGYFLPILFAAWFGRVPQAWPHEHPHAGRLETSLLLLLPPLVTALFSLLAGVFAGSGWSPLYWARFVMGGEY
jgi:multicomponent Na+:H+ antiporter subunit D